MYRGGTVQTTNYNGTAISNSWYSTVNVSGGTVQATGSGGTAIFSNNKITISGNALVSSAANQWNSATVFLSALGSLDIKGGTVQNIAANGVTIRSYSLNSASINISGGTLGAPNGTAIYNEETGKITISGNAVVTGANSNSSKGIIYLAKGNEKNTILEITGGIVQNTDTSASGRAIYNNASGDIKISNGTVDSAGGTGIFVGDGTIGTIIIPSGTPIIKAGTMAMNKAPDLSGYTLVRVLASTFPD
jgi:hypothetical protein